MGDALVVALTPGGVSIGMGLSGIDAYVDIPIVRGFADVAKLGEAGERPIVLVDDGELPAETLGAAAWALRSIASRLTVVAPIASRYLEAALPPGTRVYADRRYTPVQERSWSRERRPERPARAGHAWDPVEDLRLAAPMEQGRAAPEPPKSRADPVPGALR